MRNHPATIEYTAILKRLAELSLSDRAKEQALSLSPSLSEAECKAWRDDTTGAKRILESQGTPPLSPMAEMRKILQLCEAGAMLSPEQLTAVATFVNTCGRLAQYLRRAEAIEGRVSALGRSLYPLPELYEEIDRSIRGGSVDDQASPGLKSIRRKAEVASSSVKSKLESMLRSHADWFSERFIVTRGGRFALPVKREYKHQVSGTVVDLSSSGGTVFIEPSQARRLTDALSLLRIEEENEIRRILYTLTNDVHTYHRELLISIECMETLDFLFAKAKLSAEMKGVPPEITTRRVIDIKEGRHPLLPSSACVPLTFSIGGKVRGVIITGPNTGGKTVALKTVGLLSMMAQSGLHVPAADGSVFTMHANVLCDIGDGQSIAESLSTFSSHMTNIIAILKEAGPESLVLLDELGSGTDPMEGMGLAIAILEELRRIGCLFLCTSHYPEIKEYAKTAESLQNARMAFDRESLQPLYRLEMGEAGESCAIYIAQRLGFPTHMLRRAREAAYRSGAQEPAAPLPPEPEPEHEQPRPAPASAIREETAPPAPRRCDRFQIGDSVRVHPQKEIGIVYHRADPKGMVGVQIRKSKILVNHKRLQLLIEADALYPEDYDFSIVFDSVANRKARHTLTKRHDPDAVILHHPGEAP